jgi:hypothetical protein
MPRCRSVHPELPTGSHVNLVSCSAQGNHDFRQAALSRNKSDGGLFHPRHMEDLGQQSVACTYWIHMPAGAMR